MPIEKSKCGAGDWRFMLQLRALGPDKKGAATFPAGASEDDPGSWATLKIGGASRGPDLDRGVVLTIDSAALETGADAHPQHGTLNEWQPAEGLERRLYTLVGTVLTGIGFAALLLGIVSLMQVQLDLRRGLLLGAAGFLCVGLAPAMGLPPKPPGVPGAAVPQAQLWWAATAVLTAIGLWLLVSSRGSWPRRIAGVILLASPHLAGAPPAEAAAIVPVALAHRFAVTSVATQAIFWLSLGTLCGAFLQRAPARPFAEQPSCRP